MILIDTQTYTTTYILAFCAILILSSVLAGYLGSYSNKTQVVEGFEGSEQNIDDVNNNISHNVTEMDDRLRIDKYKNEYKKTISLTRDYLDGLKVSTLYELKSIDPKKDKPDEISKKCSVIAKKLNALHDGVKSIESIDLN